MISVDIGSYLLRRKPVGIVNFGCGGVLRSKLIQLPGRFHFSIYPTVWFRSSRGRLPRLVVEVYVVSIDLEDLLVAGPAYTHCSFHGPPILQNFSSPRDLPVYCVAVKCNMPGNRHLAEADLCRCSKCGETTQKWRLRKGIIWVGVYRKGEETARAMS